MCCVRLKQIEIYIVIGEIQLHGVVMDILPNGIISALGSNDAVNKGLLPDGMPDFLRN